jgi:hypothetical protein
VTVTKPAAPAPISPVAERYLNDADRLLRKFEGDRTPAPPVLPSPSFTPAAPLAPKPEPIHTITVIHGTQQEKIQFKGDGRRVSSHEVTGGETTAPAITTGGIDAQ